MDIVKKEEIYKGAETLGAKRERERDREGDSENPLSPRLFRERRLQEKDAVLRGDSDFEPKCRNGEE